MLARSGRPSLSQSHAHRLARASGEPFSVDHLEPRVLMSVDPITPDNPLWTIPRGSATIDGVMNDSEWANAYTVFRTQATRDDRAVFVKMMYNDQGLFLAAQVQDQTLWSDGNGSGAGNRWEVEQDDSITFYFDANDSREDYFQATDRAFGVNLANPTDSVNPANPAALARRWKFVKGDGAGGAPDVNPGGSLDTGMAYMTTLQGTVNNNADVDTGWTTEMFLPWASLGMSGLPTHGQTIGMNFQMIQDNAGSTRDLTDHRTLADRFTTPHFVDDYVDGVPSSFSATQSGVHGPIGYAEAMFIDPAAGAKPARITALTPAAVTSQSALLNFTAPAGTTGGLGHVSGYQIRYSTTSPGNESWWISATTMSNNYTPRLRGLAESLRVTGLTPSTTYFFVIRAVDAAGNLGDMSPSATVVTSALPSQGYKGNVVASPNGRTLQYENGQSFVPVGDHLNISWQYTRTLFPGLIWDNAHSQFVNFSDGAHTAVENIGTYLDDLQSKGINTMRTYLELQNTHTLGNPQPVPNGTYWFEDTPGSYNPNMHTFVNNLLAQAASRGIYIILSPFDTFAYDEAFGVEGPWAQSRTGPLSSIDFFFQQTLGTPNQSTLNLSKARMTQLVSWVNASPNKDHVLGYEFLSEWDSYEWTLHPNGGSEPGRETELRARSQYINDLAAYVKNLDPYHLVMNSTITHDPRGPVARLDFLSRNFDVLTPHMYTSGNEEPINNPQSDKKILPAREIGYFTSYWVSNRVDHAPILNGEWGMTRASWPGGVPAYSAQFTQAQDEAIFRTVMWSGFANGQVGTGLRIAADELSFNGFILTPTMRNLQKTFSTVVNNQTVPINFSNFNYDNLAGRIRATSVAGKSLLSWGISDGAQGIVYVLQNGNVTSGTVTDGIVTINGLRADQILDAEVWSTAAGTTTPLRTISGLFVGTGNNVQFSLPNFTEDVVIKFRARASTGSSQKLVAIDVGNSVVTFALGSDQQPTARISDTTNSTGVTRDISTLSGFRGKVLDMTPYKTSSVDVHLALTDTNHHVWAIHGNIANNTWWCEDLTAGNGQAGMTGDLTTYQPSWGAVHIAGLDARGHAINYWWAPAEPYWHFTDLTGSFGGPTLAGGLTGYVSGWDGLNLAGLDSNNNIVVYWWAPGIENINGGDPGKWLTQNMTSDFGGPTFTGQLDAYVTPWGGLNVAGTTSSGDVWVYWWAPGLNPNPNQWRVTNLSAAAGGAPSLLPGVEVTVSTDGGINVFGRTSSNHLEMLRWLPGGNWSATDVTAATNTTLAAFPLAGASTGNHMILASAGQPSARNVILFDFLLTNHSWTTSITDVYLAP